MLRETRRFIGDIDTIFMKFIQVKSDVNYSIFFFNPDTITMQTVIVSWRRRVDMKAALFSEGPDG